MSHSWGCIDFDSCLMTTTCPSLALTASKTLDVCKGVSVSTEASSREGGPDLRADAIFSLKARFPGMFPRRFPLGVVTRSEGISSTMFEPFVPFPPVCLAICEHAWLLPSIHVRQAQGRKLDGGEGVGEEGMRSKTIVMA